MNETSRIHCSDHHNMIWLRSDFTRYQRSVSRFVQTCSMPNLHALINCFCTNKASLKSFRIVNRNFNLVYKRSPAAACHHPRKFPHRESAVFTPANSAQLFHRKYQLHRLEQKQRPRQVPRRRISMFSQHSSAHNPCQ